MDHRTATDPLSGAPDLRWAVDAVWGRDGPARVATGDDVPAGHRVVERFAILPNVRAPRLLVPMGNRRATAAAFRRFGAGMTGAARTGRAIAGLAAAVGAAPMLFRDRLVVTAPRNTTPDERATSSVTDHLRAALDRPDLAFAIYVGVPRPNRKPVLQILAEDGAVVGFAKVGWNDLTRALVRTEAAALGALAEDPPAAFSAPRVIEAGPVRDREVLTMAPLPAGVSGRASAVTSVPLDATREVSHRGGTSCARLADASAWRSLRERAGTAARDASGDDADRIRAAIVDIGGRAGDMELAFGSWHGDWAPWNMARADGRLYVWDWERSARPAPVGFDVAHFHHQVLRRRRPLPTPAELVRALRAAAGPDLSALEVAPDAHGVVIATYLLELSMRYRDAVARDPSAPDATGALSTATLEAASLAARSI